MESQGTGVGVWGRGSAAWPSWRAALEGRVQAWPRASAGCSSSEGCYSACLPSPRPLRAAPAVFQAQFCPRARLDLGWIAIYLWAFISTTVTEKSISPVSGEDKVL